MKSDIFFKPDLDQGYKIIFIGDSHKVNESCCAINIVEDNGTLDVKIFKHDLETNKKILSLREKYDFQFMIFKMNYDIDKWIFCPHCPMYSYDINEYQKLSIYNLEEFFDSQEAYF